MPQVNAKPKPTTQRREREREARRQLILDAAKIVFAERGFLNATMEEIAERCERGCRHALSLLPE